MLASLIWRGVGWPRSSQVDEQREEQAVFKVGVVVEADHHFDAGIIGQDVIEYGVDIGQGLARVRLSKSC